MMTSAASAAILSATPDAPEKCSTTLPFGAETVTPFELTRRETGYMIIGLK
jgi:hypothetical protein